MYRVLVTLTHSLICPGPLAIVIDCDCSTVQSSLQGYPESLNVQFIHNNFKTEKGTSTRCSAESTKSLDSGGTVGLWMYYTQMFHWQKEPHLATLQMFRMWVQDPIWQSKYTNKKPSSHNIQNSVHSVNCPFFSTWVKHTLIANRYISPCVRDDKLIFLVCTIGVNFLFLIKFLVELSSVGAEWMPEHRTKRNAFFNEGSSQTLNIWVKGWLIPVCWFVKDFWRKLEEISYLWVQRYCN